MRPVLKWVGRALLVLVVLLGLGIGLLALTTPGPRETEGWTRVADMPVPRGEVAMAVTSGQNGAERVFVAGGIRGLGQSSPKVSVYDIAGDRWSDGPDLPERRDHAAAAAVEGTVYVSGGQPRVTAGTPRPNLWALRPRASSWEELEPLPEGRWGHGKVAHDGALYVVGGDGPSADVLIYEDGRWHTGAPLPVQRDHLSVVVHEGLIWAIGGRSGFREVLDRVDVYDPARDTWGPGPPLPVPMSAMAAGVIEGTIHVVGGERPAVIGGGVIDRHYVLGPDDRAWRQGPLPVVAVHGSPGVAADGRLVVAGGSRRQGALSVLGWTGITQVYPR